MAEQTLNYLYEKLKTAAPETDMVALTLIQDNMEKVLEENPNLKSKSLQENNSATSSNEVTNKFLRKILYL